MRVVDALHAACFVWFLMGGIVSLWGSLSAQNADERARWWLKSVAPTVHARLYPIPNTPQEFVEQVTRRMQGAVTEEKYLAVLNSDEELQKAFAEWEGGIRNFNRGLKWASGAILTMVGFSLADMLIRGALKI